MDLNSVLFISQEFFNPHTRQTGGLGSYLWKIMNILEAHGVVCILLAPGSEDHVEQISDKIIVRSIVLPAYHPPVWAKFFNVFVVKIFGFSIIQYFRLKSNARHIAKKVNYLCKERSIDIVQYTNLNGYSLYHPKHIPYVIRLSSITEIYNKLGKGYYGMPTEKVKAQIAIEKLALHKAQYIFSPSKSMLAYVKNINKKDSAIIETPFHNYSVNRQGLSNPLLGTEYIFYFGSIDYRKGCDLLINAFKQVAHPGLKLVYAGKFQGTSKEDLAIHQELQNNNPSIIYVGELNKKELHSYLIHATFVVLPSRVDNFPNTMVEAIHAGKIVIGPNNWGFEQLICDGISGFLFESGDKNDLTIKIKQVLTLSDLEKTKIEMSAIKSTERLKSDNVFNNYLNFLEKCCKQFESISEKTF